MANQLYGFCRMLNTILDLRQTQTCIVDGHLCSSKLLSEHEQPVSFAPVYGSLFPNKAQHNLYAIPLVLEIGTLKQFLGLVEDSSTSFTVVPILALDATTFGFLSAVPETLSPDASDLGLCKKIVNCRV
jgi:hypothetical protein